MKKFKKPVGLNGGISRKAEVVDRPYGSTEQSNEASNVHAYNSQERGSGGSENKREG